MASRIWQKPEMMEMEGKVTTACKVGVGWRVHNIWGG